MDGVPRLTVRADADSAAGWACVGIREMLWMNAAMTTRTAVVAHVSSHSITRRNRRRLRRRAATAAWRASRTSVSKLDVGIPMLPG